MNTLRGNSVFQSLKHFAQFKQFEQSIKEKKYPLSLYGIHGAFQSILITNLHSIMESLDEPLLIVVPTEQEAESLKNDLGLINVEVDIFPWWGAIPYRAVAPGSLVFGDRTYCLSRILTKNAKIIITIQRAFQTPLPSKEYFSSLLYILKKGDSIDSMAIEEKLSHYGYTKVPKISAVTEFALRGEVLDIWINGYEYAHRIVFDFDTIDEIREFSPSDQASIGKCNEICIIPVKEILWDNANIDILESKLQDAALYPHNGKVILEELRTKNEAKGEEIFYPLLFSEATSILDYIGHSGVVIFSDYDRQKNQDSALLREYTGLYRKARIDFDAPPPEKVLIPFEVIEQKCAHSIFIRSLHDSSNEDFTIDFNLDPARSFFGNIIYFKEELSSLIKNGWKALIFAESEVQAERLSLVLKDIPVEIVPESISQGFGIPQLKTIFIQENEIFGRKKRIPKTVKTARSVSIDTFIELNPLDYVVHVNYGIGQFLSIDRMKVMGFERDYIKLQYADEETVFIPIEQVNLIQRYIGNEGNVPHLDRIGSKSWENRKSKVKKHVEELAERLIRLYSKRLAATGYAFPRDSEWQTAFEAAFPYNETVDQLTCIEEVKADMETTKPMDRMVCGDVGYGKTEIAMRACFKSVMGGKQVAFLAPTTILAEQHYDNFQDRFSAFPIRIACLSRLVPKSEQKKILAQLVTGEIDILVGTHRLLQKDVCFKDLGFMVIDEEQRFGVKDKERLKEMRTNIDCLTLTATPIPRTLHMSLLKIRDMSVLSTPPSNRHPIETFIEEMNTDLIADAIRREVARGGQVFYLHNRVDSLEDTRIMLSNLMPEMLIETAHGKMDPQDLEDLMHRFVHGGFHILVSTTIIESGIDIPNVNTIIIERADMFGLGQLYQLRGRVGRSDRVAYAYLFYPEKKALSEIAMKRLQIISEFTELGSGFKIAMKDMEVRGAGNLLGAEQSGEIYAVGFDLYLKMLEEAVHKLKDEHWTSEQDVYLELEYQGFIPDSYIKNASVKMEVYKKIAGIQTQDELDRIYAELEDRFGPIPDEIASLLALSEIRILCRDLSITSLKEKQGSVEIEFSRVAKVSVEKVIRMMKESQGRVKLDPERPNILILKTGSIGLKEKSEFIREKINALSIK